MARIFTDRSDAGRQLAAEVAKLPLADPVVLALPRGGVPVACEVAHLLHAPLNLLIVRKIGAPGHEEYGIGAVVDGSDPQIVFNDEAVALFQPSPEYIADETARQLSEIERRRSIYLGDKPALSIRGREVILVDDGIATGGTARAALLALRRSGAKRIVLAVPVAPADTVASLRKEADNVICLAVPDRFHAVSQQYEDFEQTSDEDVIRLLSTATGK